MIVWSVLCLYIAGIAASTSCLPGVLVAACAQVIVGAVAEQFLLSWLVPGLVDAFAVCLLPVCLRLLVWAPSWPADLKPNFLCADRLSVGVSLLLVLSSCLFSSCPSVCSSSCPLWVRVGYWDLEFKTGEKFFDSLYTFQKVKCDSLLFYNSHQFSQYSQIIKW